VRGRFEVALNLLDKKNMFNFKIYCEITGKNGKKFENEKKLRKNLGGGEKGAGKERKIKKEGERE
jgi:hypothetical protein